MRAPSRQIAAVRRVALVALLSALVSPAAPAQEKGSDAGTEVYRCSHKKSAVELQRAGLLAIEARDLLSARRAITEAYICAPSVELLYHLGRIAVAENRQVEGHDLFQRYLAEPPQASAEAPHSAAAEALKNPLPAAGKVNVLGERGALLFLEGRLVGALPLSLPLLATPGRHQVRLDYGKSHRQGPIEVMPGRLLEVQFEANSGAVLMNLVPAVLVLERFGDPEAQSAPKYRATLAKLLEERKLYMLTQQSALAHATQLASCLQTLACQVQLAEKNSADYVLIAELAEQRENGRLRAAFTLIDVEIGDVAAAAQWSCTRCTLESAATQLQALIEKLFSDGSSRPRGTLVVRTQPAGAELALGGLVVGVTPYQHAVYARELEVSIRHPGHREERRHIRIAAGQKQLVELELVAAAANGGAVPQPTPAQRRRPLWRLGVGGAALSVGSLMLGFGAAAFAQNNDCVSPKEPLAEVCRKIYDTNRLGGGLLGVGIPLIAFGALFIAIPQR